MVVFIYKYIKINQIKMYNLVQQKYENFKFVKNKNFKVYDLYE